MFSERIERDHLHEIITYDRLSYSFSTSRQSVFFVVNHVDNVDRWSHQKSFY